MKEIEEALHNLHARDKDKRQRDEAEAKVEALQCNQTLPDAFAKVDAVTPGSPASMCGLQVGDEIIAFGSVNTNNFQTLQNIATVVQHSEGVSAHVKGLLLPQETIKRDCCARWKVSSFGTYTSTMEWKRAFRM
ncbi:hypothetical protein GDO81_002354 [Engystomops pustulosus]|nr:hypothetical protein GDO81_002354 [Engystomops pustulosus]